MKKWALLSVYDKTCLEEFARFLEKIGYSLLATGGSKEILSEKGLEVTEVSQYTGSKEILGGRVKTLHPKIHAGLLACRDNTEHSESLRAEAIDPIDVLVVNLYPFFEKLGEGLSSSDLIEFIDIGGSAMIRAAAKNHRHVLVVSDPADYAPLMEEWKSSGQWSQATRRRLAGQAFGLTSAYDAAIASCFLDKDQMPSWLSFSYRKARSLRYGENPQQKAAWYVPSSSASFGALSAIVQHQGKELSLNNLRDLDTAWKIVTDFERPSSVGVKHCSPCAVASGDNVLDSWKRVYAADPLSIFGGIVAFNQEVDASVASALCEIFLEVIVAPCYSPAALKIFQKKKNLRLVSLDRPPSDPWEVLPVDGGICLQERDVSFFSQKEWSIPTIKKPTASQMQDLSFAWKVVKQSKSNAIVLAKGEKTVGMGSGQTSRIAAVSLALESCRERGAVLASDAFFPFDDAVKTAAAAGILAIIQPGGSRRDKDSIEACNQAEIAMVFTGRRQFRH